MTSTHTANPVCCAATLANLQALEDEDAVGNAARLGRSWPRRATAMQRRLERADRQGRLGRPGRRDPVRRRPGQPRPTTTPPGRSCGSAWNRGVLLFAPVGVGGGAIKINPPLIITEGGVPRGARRGAGGGAGLDELEGAEPGRPRRCGRCVEAGWIHMQGLRGPGPHGVLGFEGLRLASVAAPQTGLAVWYRRLPQPLQVVTSLRPITADGHPPEIPLPQVGETPRCSKPNISAVQPNAAWISSKMRRTRLSHQARRRISGRCSPRSLSQVISRRPCPGPRPLAARPTRTGRMRYRWCESRAARGGCRRSSS